MRVRSHLAVNNSSTAGLRQRPMEDANPATAHMFIVKAFAGRGVLSLFSTHPPTQQRVARLPALARPQNGHDRVNPKPTGDPLKRARAL